MTLLDSKCTHVNEMPISSVKLIVQKVLDLVARYAKQVLAH